MLKIGGMALENGVLLQTQGHWSAAVREPDGGIAVAGGAKSFAPALVGRAGESVPLVRGPLRMLDALAVVAQAKSALPQAKLPLQSPIPLGVAVLASLALGLLRGRRPARRPAGVFGEEMAAAALALAPAVVALRGSDLAAYHGAEHKSIAAFECTSVPAEVAKEHSRCGSNLVVPLLTLEAVGSMAVRRMFRRPPAGAYVATGLLSLAGAFELLRWAGAHPESRVARWLMASGEFLQRALTTKEPAAEHLAVADAALRRLLELEGVPSPAAP